jgi:hypothetical protein
MDKVTSASFNSSCKLSFIYRLKLYALFINGGNETALYRLICYIKVHFKAGLTIAIY